MVLLEAVGTNNTFVLVFGTMTLVLAAFSLIIFAFLFQRKLINKQRAFRDIEMLLQKQETKTTYAVLKAQEQERKRIAEDLHDRLGSRLAAVKLHFHAFKNNASGKEEFFTTGSELLDGAVEEVREISHNLLSGILSKFGLTAALNDLKTTLESSKQLVFNLHIHHLESRFDLLVEVTIYRVVQELVSNILKHALASEVTLQLTRFESEILLILEDNGKGFDTQLSGIQSGIGLSNVQSRISKLNGTFNVDSSPGKGTIITIEIPILND